MKIQIETDEPLSEIHIQLSRGILSGWEEFECDACEELEREAKVRRDEKLELVPDA